MNDDRVLLEGLERVPAFDGVAAFFYFHLMSAHVAGLRLDNYARYQPAAPIALRAWDRGNEAEARSQAVNFYDNGVMQADAILENLFKILDDKGYLQDSMVVILGDHGDGLGRHGYGHAYTLYQETIGIPLLIYDAEGFRYANLRFATQLDVAPTILDRLGLQIPASWQGRSLLKAPVEPMCSVHQTRRLDPYYAVVCALDQRIVKYIQCGYCKKEELYDLTSDPDEVHNLIATADSALLAWLQRTLAENLGHNIGR